MRGLADAERVRRFLRALGRRARRPARLYLTGGATAVLLGWRESTIDIDLYFVPEHDELFRALARLKDDLDLNVELVSPAHFIPVPEGWEERSLFEVREGTLDVFHFDLAAQALAKIERGHRQDTIDVDEMLRRGLVTADWLREAYERVEPQLYRYPALDAASFRQAVMATLRGQTG